MLRHADETDRLLSVVPPPSASVRKRRAWQTSILVGLSLQFTLYALSRSRLKSALCDGQVLLLAEVIKLGCSATLARDHYLVWCRAASEALVPCVCFAVMNLLSFWAMRHVSATCAVVLLQTKLPMTVLWSRVLLKRKISAARSVVLLLVSVGTLGVALDATAASSGHDAPARIVPVLALLCETFISGFSSVYSERMFQRSNMWVRNVQLSVLGVIAYAVSTCTPYLHTSDCTWSLAVVDANGVLVAALSAAGGLLVALALKFVGSIEKTVVTLTSVISIGVVEGVMLSRMPSYHFVLYSATTMLAVGTYALIE